MIPKAGCLIAITALMAQTQASAQVYFRDGHRVVEDCRSSDAILRNNCSGYVLGVLDALEGERTKSHQPSCLEPSPAAGETVTQFVAALEANPAFNSPMPAIVGLSLAYQARCKARS